MRTHLTATRTATLFLAVMALSAIALVFTGPAHAANTRVLTVQKTELTGGDPVCPLTGAYVYSALALGPLDLIGTSEGDYPTYTETVQAFGRPHHTWTSGDMFVAHWEGKRAMKMFFRDLPTETDHSGDLLQQGTLTGKRWRVTDGARIGMKLRKLRRRYPQATRHGRNWWLFEACGGSSYTEVIPAVSVKIRRKRVKAINFRLI